MSHYEKSRSKLPFVGAIAMALVAAVAIVAFLIAAEEVNATLVLSIIGLAVAGSFFAVVAVWSRRGRGALLRADDVLNGRDVAAESIVWKRRGTTGGNRGYVGYATDRELILVPLGEEEEIEQYELDRLTSLTFHPGLRNARLGLRFDSGELELRSVKSDLRRLYEAMGKHQSLASS